jgi:uncharacterized protein (DUF1778 family)
MEKMKRTERLGARVPGEVKALLQRAADLTGRSLSDFVVASAQAAAEEIIRQHAVIRLTATDSRKLAEALLNPPPPNPRLLAASQDYERFTGQAASRER